MSNIKIVLFPLETKLQRASVPTVTDDAVETAPGSEESVSLVPVSENNNCRINTQWSTIRKGVLSNHWRYDDRIEI